jgi:NDMA-dependent alcohol dehydrogenase
MQSRAGAEGRAAIQWARDQSWSIDRIRVDPPGPGEVLIRVRAAGLCHSDLHMVQGGYPELSRPIVGGHEGAGVVEMTGPGTTGFAVGDHVLFCIPVPPCGTCAACLRGLPYLCERGALVGQGRQISDGTSRHHAGDRDLAIFVFLGAFSEFTVVNAASCLRVNQALSFAEICTISCAGVTGWGSVQNTAELRAGETAVVVGVGGVGANAVAAARFLGASWLLAVDPLEPRRELAVRLGADAAVPDLPAAAEAVASATYGRGADAVIMAMSAGDGHLISDALALLGKRGRLVVVNVHPETERLVSLTMRDLQLYEKQIRGCLSGSWHGRRGAEFLVDLARRGRYDPAAIVDRTYALDQINLGYQDQAAGRTVRAVILMPEA